jgi:hypothetical protein
MATTARYATLLPNADTWRHALLDCNMARVVWALMEDDLTRPLFDDETSDPKLWLFSLRNTLSQEKFIEVLFFG